MRTLVINKVNQNDLIEIKDKTFQKERSLYNSKNTLVSNCKFEGKEDGESPLKESKDIIVEKCYFDLRYALWHVDCGDIISTSFSKNARAPFWYSKHIKLLESSSESVKIFRECNDIIVQNSKVLSEEPFWNSKNVTIVDSKISGFYAFFGSKNVLLNHVEFDGKYSFQYVKNLEIKDSTLDTKDAFWHTKNAVVRDSVIKGEYIGWYSENLTFINCTIESHQPFCYCKNLKLIDCKMPNSDLAFENSTVKGNIIGKLNSIKNPINLKMKIDKVGEIIKEQPTNKVRINLVK